MYSWEIDEYIKKHNFCLTPNEYFLITNYKDNPQLSRVTYNAFNDDYTIRTVDNYCWNIKVKGLF